MMSPSEAAGIPGEVAPVTAESPRPVDLGSRPHLVVVTTRPLQNEAGPNSLRSRFWHPGDQRWSENDFQNLEHALRLFVDESGWVLRQEQGLDAPLSREWIFEARRIDFSRPSKEEILQDIGLTPERVTRLLDDVS